jgi:hypothetical protein
MSLILSGTDGLSDVDGSAATPAIRGTDTNTGIFFPAADTIAFSEGGVEAMRIDSDGDVGIGTTNPLGKFEVHGQSRFASSASSAVLLIDAAATSTDGVDIQSSYYGGAGYGPMKFSTGGSERMRIDSSGNLLVGITSARANAGDVQVSKGISFPATQSAQSDANTLDDYEEGEWTGVIAGSTTAGTFSNLVNHCSYTKIGRQVTVQYYVQWESGTGTGNLILTGLPFTSRNAVGFYYAGTLSYANVLRTANATPAPNLYHNSTQIEFLQIPTTDGDSTSIPYDAAGRLMGMHTYFTA